MKSLICRPAAQRIVKAEAARGPSFSTRTSAAKSSLLAATAAALLLVQGPSIAASNTQAEAAIEAQAQDGRNLAPYTNPVRQQLTRAVQGFTDIVAKVPEEDLVELSPLWRAVKGNKVEEVARVLNNPNAPVDVDERDPITGDTPLLYVTRQGHYRYPPQKIPAELIKAGANLEARDDEGHTPLMVAADIGWQFTGSLLVDAGASTAELAQLYADGYVTCPDGVKMLEERGIIARG